MADRSSRSNRVAQLWELKTRLDNQRPGKQSVRFNQLLRDAVYRQAILQHALASHDGATQKLARQLLSEEDERELLAAPETWRQNDSPTPARNQWPLRFGLAVVVGIAAATLAAFTTLQQPRLISGSINSDTLWEKGRHYRLRGPVYVEQKATLTIEPGVVVEGEYGSSLVITRGARLLASGSAQQPIVFTSSRPAGQRAAGDWGGVVLLGSASVNQVDARIEGVPEHDQRGHYGGSDDDDSCGVLQYLRIEFAGFEVYANNELNGLTLAGCGRNTIVRQVQVHRALDDGIEIFGGTVDLKQVVISGAGDDGLDWDQGWRGRVQQLIVHQFEDLGDNAIEGDNNSEADAQPRSQPVIYNASLISSRSAQKAQRAMTLRRGSGGHFHNLLIQGFSLEAIDLRDTVQDQVDTTELTASHILISDTGPSGSAPFTLEQDKTDDDRGFDETQFFSGTPGYQLLNRPVVDPIGLQTRSPHYAPSFRQPPISAEVPQGEFWEESARYPGAVAPGSTLSWLTGWTDFPES